MVRTSSMSLQDVLRENTRLSMENTYALQQIEAYQDALERLEAKCRMLQEKLDQQRKE